MTTDLNLKSQANAPFILVGNSKDGDDSVTVHDLTVKTPGKNGIVLVEDINMTLNKGDRVLLVGESGSGKTTVVKSLLSKWDQGSGIITMPSSTKIMGMAQKAYFPDVTLRSVMNLMPEGQAKFDDKELTAALQKVGLSKLVQHIPGQQTEILMNDLLSEIKELLQPIKDAPLSEQKVEALRHAIHAQVVRLVEEQFEIVQFTPDEQREYFRNEFAKLMADTLQRNNLKKKEIKAISNEILDNIDIELARPLKNRLEYALNDATKRRRAVFAAYTDGEVDVMARMLDKQLKYKLDQYMGNKDTDDSNRLIRINKAQANHIADVISKKFPEIMRADNTSWVSRFVQKGAVQPIKRLFNAAARGLPNIVPDFIKKPLSATFNASSSTVGWIAKKALWAPKKLVQGSTWAATRLSIHNRAKGLANELVQNTNFFMDSQIVKGDQWTNSSRLSGGQKQMLMIATVLLHKPDVLILDEIAASLDKKNAKELYKSMMEALPEDTIVVSIAHNDEILREYHTHYAQLKDKTITIEPIDHENAAQPEAPSSPDTGGNQGPRPGGM